MRAKTFNKEVTMSASSKERCRKGRDEAGLRRRRDENELKMIFRVLKSVHDMSYNILEINKREVCYERI